MIAESYNCERTFGTIVVWHSPITVQSNTDFSFLGGLEFFTVEFDSMCMREDDAVADTIEKVCPVSQGSIN